MFQRSLTLLILTFVTTSSALAGDCSFVDVRENMTPELQEHFRTPFDQGPLGWCYAYTASDMMAQAVGVPVSATYTGAYYSTNMNPVMRFVRGLVQDSSVPEGGFTNVAIEDMQKSGMLCKDSVLTSQGVIPNIRTSKGPGQGKLSLLFYYLEQYRNNKCTKICSEYLDGLIEAYFPGLDVSDVKKHFVDHKSENLEYIAADLFKNICEHDPILIEKNQFKIKIVDKSTGSSRFLPTITTPVFMDSLDQALENGKVVGVEYDASFVDPKLTVLNKYHASTVIGREMVGQACYYRVRNTWGKSFTKYAPGILFGDTDGTYLVDRVTFRNMSFRLLWIE